MGARLRTAWVQRSVSAYAWFLPRASSASRPLLAHAQLAAQRLSALPQLSAEGENRRFWRANTGYARAARRSGLLLLLSGASFWALFSLPSFASLAYGAVLSAPGSYSAALAAVVLPLLMLGATPARLSGIVGLGAALAGLLWGVRPGHAAPRRALSPVSPTSVVGAGLAALPQSAFRALAALALADHLRFPQPLARPFGLAAPQPAAALLWGSSWVRLLGVPAAPLGQTWAELSAQSHGRAVQARLLSAALARRAEAEVLWRPALAQPVGVSPMGGLYAASAGLAGSRFLGIEAAQSAARPLQPSTIVRSAPVFQLVQPALTWAPQRVR